MIFGVIIKGFHLSVNGVLVMASFFFRLRQGQFSGEKVNVVLVHGFLVRKQILFLLKKKLERLGFNVILPELGWGTRDITSYAKDGEHLLSTTRWIKKFYIIAELHGVARGNLRKFSTK